MNLTLTRPLVFVDLETTGTNLEVDHIVQIACIKYLPPTGAPDDNGDRIEKETLVRPPVAIPAEATEVHGITDDMVKTAPTFRALAKSLAGFFEGADVAGYNVKRFDWPMLLAEFSRAGVAVEKRRRFVDAQAIFFAKHPRTLSAAAKLYCGEDHADAHSALADIRMTEKVLWAQLGAHEDLPRTVEALDAALFPVDPDAVDPDGKLKWRGDEVIVNFGKNKGTALRHLDTGFFRWVLTNDFADEVKAIVREAMNGKFPTRRAA